MPAERGRRFLALLLTGALAACQDSESALARGDRLWADSNYTGALAEYRLSYARNRSPEVLARVAHGYAVTGQMERAREAYDQLLALDSGYADQAVFDYLDLARRADERSDRYGMAGAVEAALALRPALPVERMTGALARYYQGTGDTERALQYFERALAAAPPDSVAGLLYELAGVHETRGDCREAIELLNAFRDRAGADPRQEQARYRIGSCSWTLAQAAREAGEAERALYLIETVTSLGAPQAVQGEAWFARGEILLEQGRAAEALEAYQRVLLVVRSRGGQLAQQAQQRIDQIRFGRTGGPDAGGYQRNRT